MEGREEGQGVERPEKETERKKGRRGGGEGKG